MPNCLAGQHGKFLTISGIRFAYGHDQVQASMESNAEYSSYREYAP